MTDRLESSGKVVSYPGERDRPKPQHRLTKVKVVCDAVSTTLPGGHVAFAGESTLLVPTHELAKVQAMVRSEDEQRQIDAAKRAFEDAVSMELVDEFAHAKVSIEDVHDIHEKALRAEQLTEDEKLIEQQRHYIYQVTGNSWQAEYYRATRRRDVSPLLSMKVLDQDLRYPEQVELSRASDGTINQLLAKIVDDRLAKLAAEKDQRISELEAQLEEATAPRGKSKG